MSEKTLEQYVNEIREKLDAKIPRSAVSSRDGGRGMKLSYLEGHYVIARLNQVFGQGNWAYGIQKQEKLWEGTVEGKYGPSFSVSYSATVKLVVQFAPNITTEFIEVGYGDGSDKTNPGKAHELALKESVTDGLKRAAKNLGMSMGLALYDKEQPNVDDGDEAVVTAAKAKSAPTTTMPAPASNRPKINKLIKDTAAVLIHKKVMTAPELVTLIKSNYSVDKTEALSDTQANEFLKTLEAKL